MTDVEATYDEFIASRRSGRRNAIHDIPAASGEEGDSELPQLNITKSGDEGENKDTRQDSPVKEEETKAEGS